MAKDKTWSTEGKGAENLETLLLLLSFPLKRPIYLRLYHSGLFVYVCTLDFFLSLERILTIYINVSCKISFKNCYSWSYNENNVMQT